MVVFNVTNKTIRDFGHVNQFLREYLNFRAAVNEPVFMKCVEQKEIYICEYKINGELYTTYQTTLSLLNKEVAYNKSTHTL